jgi:Ca2+-transporting ATPase
LWINLVTDGLPGLALASEPAEGNVMKRQPRTHNKNIFAGKMALHIISVGLLMGLVTWAFSIGLFMLTFHIGKQLLYGPFFSQMGHVMAIRSGRESLLKLDLFK